MPSAIYSIPVHRYTASGASGFTNDEIIAEVTSPVAVGAQGSTSVTIRALSDSSKLASLTTVRISVTVPHANFGTLTVDPTSFTAFTLLGSRPTSRVWDVTAIQKGDTVKFTVPFTPGQAGEKVVTFTFFAQELNRRVEIQLPLTITESTSS